ncbi:MAG: aspartate aminotransferase family protein [Ignavibacteriae bacterium]|nr:aspartate aminotransferase family protein [Ignavibacteria bacterium]MBI3365266.1 aspartate aminotransferase family protein [Ignavibacteriota bacterium]
MILKWESSQRHIGSTVDWGHGFVVEKAYGATIVDIDGREYIDFSSGWNTANIGWGRPEIKQAILRQLEKTAFRPVWCVSEPEIKLAEKLVALTPNPLEVCFKATGGTESNEIALMLARSYTTKSKIISFETEYHGGTYGSLSLSRTKIVTKKLGPMLPDIVQVSLPPCFFDPCMSISDCRDRCFTEIGELLSAGDVAAVIIEAVLTNPGVFKPGLTFFSELRRRCDEAKALLIIDEVGTGFGRTGKMFAIEHFNIVPDIMTIAKGLSGGYVPIGATITTKEIARSGKGVLDTPTFGWTPLACAAALASIEIIEKEQLCNRADEMGKYIRDQLSKLLRNVPFVGNIRGVGMELAIDVVKANGERWYEGAARVVSESEKKGLIIEMTGSVCAVMLMPPLIITKEQIDIGISRLVESFKSLKS